MGGFTFGPAVNRLSDYKKLPFGYSGLIRDNTNTLDDLNALPIKRFYREL
jgi:hypothetical protein